MMRYAILLIFPVLFFSCLNKGEIVYDYLPNLGSLPIKTIHEKKLYLDPIYKLPYNVYLELSVDSNDRNKLISNMLLKNKYEIDTVNLKKFTNIDEFQNYFEMKSINLNRSPSNNFEEKIKWWPRNEFNGTVYCASYFDSSNKRKIVSYDQKKNGRISVFFKGVKVFVLIECWG